MKKVKVAVIGTGNMGKFHVNNYHKMKIANLVAIADIDEKKGMKMAKDFSCNFYADFKEMIEKEKPEYVSIVVPTKLHKKIALYCISKGINVLVEKPISNNLVDAQKIIDAAKKKGVKLYIGHIERFNPVIEQIKKIITSGKLGKISSIIVRRVGIYPPQIKDANVIIDLAVHDIDIVSYLLQRAPNKIEANGGKAISGNRVDYIDIFMKYGDVSVLLQSNWITPVKIRNLSITGSKGYLEMDYITQEITMFETKYNKLPDSYGDLVVKFGTPKKVKVNVKKEEPLKRELTAFLSGSKKLEKYAITPMQAKKTLDIALKINKMI